MPTAPRRRLTAAVALSTVTLAAAVTPPAAEAVTTSIAVAEVYGGGGNSGAPYASDYVELVNTSDQPVDLSGWSVQYWSAKGTTPQRTALSGTVAPGARYLVKQADGAATGATPLPTPDAVGTIPMSSSAGRVAVVDGSGAVVDLVGYGEASASEGSPAPATSNTRSAARKDPCVDTDDNLADFAIGAPQPQNSTTAVLDCSASNPPEEKKATVAEIQGRSHRSPLEGTKVGDVRGVVTAVARNGFYLQSSTPDEDDATSEGVFVFTRSAPTVGAGDEVVLGGTVSEYRPGGETSGKDNLTTTQIASPSVRVTASGQPLPAPVVLGVDRVAPQQNVTSGDPGDVERKGTPFDPSTDALDFDESLEGMRVGLRDAVAVGPTQTKYGELPVVPGQRVSATRSPSRGVVYGSYKQPNSMRLTLDAGLLPKGAMPAANVGDVLPGQTVGVMDYSFATYRLMLTGAPQHRSSGLQRETTRKQRGHELAIATFNVENLAPSDPATKFQRLGRQVVDHLSSPDVVALEEIQDSNGSQNDGVVDSTTTSDKLIAAITAAGGPTYRAAWVNPQDGADGGQPGGNIRQVFLYRTDRGLQHVDRPGGDATSATQVVGKGRRTHLSASPGRIDPANPAWKDSRKPLVSEFRFRGRSYFVIANHFSSKGGDDPLTGRWQQPERPSESQRHQQARVVRGFVDKLLAADRRANVVTLGDVNDFEFSTTTDLLVGDDWRTRMTDLPRTLPRSERYSYVFQGNSQVLDHILISPALAYRPFWPLRAFEYDIVHTNSEFHDQDSDHDPQVVRLDTRRLW